MDNNIYFCSQLRWWAFKTSVPLSHLIRLTGWWGVLTDLQIILSLLGTRFINPNPTDRKWSYSAKIGTKMSKIGQNPFQNVQIQSKNVQTPLIILLITKSTGYTFKILLTAKNTGCTSKILLMLKSAGDIFKILLLVPKPTGHEVPRCRNNLQL